MDLGIGGKWALVCGASKGLGFGCAQALAREGVHVVIVARGAQALEEAADRLRQETAAGPQTRIEAIPADITTPEGRAKVFEFRRDFDILVTNAGGPPAGRFDQLTQEQWEQAARLTLYSAVHLAREVLPGMKARRWGRILNITSIAVKQPVDNLMLSNSLRAGLTGFARTLANEVAADGVTVNNILPGYTRTERLEELAGMMADKLGISAGEFRRKWEAEIPMGRLGDPREFAAVAAFLVSERASYITGTSIQVDGGWIKSLF
jgi:3-oxoacyl-[acyl-carrier protein] reductase